MFHVQFKLWANNIARQTISAHKYHYDSVSTNVVVIMDFRANIYFSSLPKHKRMEYILGM